MSELELPTVERIRGLATETPTARHDAPTRTLQTTIGNRAIARMLQREGAPEEEELQAKHDPALQREEAPEEEEMQAKHDPALQREEAPEEEEMQAKHDTSNAIARAPEVGLGGGAVSSGLAARIDGQRGGGSPLDHGTRSQMEDAFGAPLDDVRVHVGQESDALNHAITAKAFTTGSDVFVRSDQWAPGSSSTQRLMAHELTHVVQQRSMAGDGGGMSVGAADTAEEREADDVADAVAQRSVDGPQRDEDE